MDKWTYRKMDGHAAKQKGRWKERQIDVVISIYPIETSFKWGIIT